MIYPGHIFCLSYFMLLRVLPGATSMHDSMGGTRYIYMVRHFVVREPVRRMQTQSVGKPNYRRQEREWYEREKKNISSWEKYISSREGENIMYIKRRAGLVPRGGGTWEAKLTQPAVWKHDSNPTSVTISSNENDHECLNRFNFCAGQILLVISTTQKCTFKHTVQNIYHSQKPVGRHVCPSRKKNKIKNSTSYASRVTWHTHLNLHTSPRDTCEGEREREREKFGLPNYHLDYWSIPVGSWRSIIASWCMFLPRQLWCTSTPTYLIWSYPG